MRAEEENINNYFSINTEGSIGGIIGVIVLIWVSVQYMEPTFREIHGINDTGAKALTALVDICGGIEAAYVIGDIAGKIVINILSCLNNVNHQVPVIPINNNRITVFATPVQENDYNIPRAEVVYTV